MARRLIVEIVGDASQLERSFSRAQRSTRGFNRDISKLGRGALVGTGALGGLGRAAAFASGAFIGGAGLTFAIKSTIAAAMESQRVGAQLTNVLQQQGAATKANISAIDRRTQALSQMAGVDDELATQTFIDLFRATGNVSKALRDNEIAADIARARNIDLQAAAALVTKAELGQAGALRRVGIAAKQGASATELLDLLQRKFAGSAEAYGNTAAGAQERFSVALENTQEIIGTALLPALTRLLNRASDWLNQQENQKKIQDFVNESVDKGTAAAGALASGYDKLRGAVKWVQGTDPFGGKSLLDFARGLGSTNDEIERMLAGFKELFALQKRVASGFAQIETARQGAIGGLVSGPTFEIPSKVKGGGTFVGRPLTEQERLSIALAANPDDVQALKQQRALRQRALDFAQKHLDAERGNTAKFAAAAERLTSDIAAINLRLAGISEDAAQKAKDAAQRIKDAAAKRRQAVLDAVQATIDASGIGATTLGVSGGPLTLQQVRRAVLQNEARARQAAQFKALGLTATGDELAPTRKALQQQLNKINESFAGSILDTKENRNFLTGAQQVLNKKFGDVNRTIRLRMKEMFDALAGDKSGGPLTNVQAVTGRRLSQILGAQLGLSAAQERGLRLNITGAHFTSASLASGAAFSPTIQTRVDIDGRQVALATHQHSERARRRTATQTRGRVLP